MKYDMHSHWRDSARQPRLFFIDARVCWFLLLFLVHVRWWTFITMVVCMTFFVILDYFKIPLVVAFRIMKGFVVGKKRIRVVRGNS